MKAATKNLHYNGGIIRRRGPSFWAEVNANNQRHRRTFGTEGAAREWIDTCQVELHNALEPLSASRYFEAHEAWKALPEGVSLLAVAKEYAARTRRGEDLPIAEAVERYLADREAAGLKIKSLNSARQHLDKFASQVRGSVQDVTAETVRGFLAPWRGQTRRNYRADVHSFFAWLVLNKHAFENPAAAIPAPKITPKMPEFLTVADVEKLFTAAEEHHPDLCAFLAVGFFAGVRSSELELLRFEDCASTVRIGPEIAKTRRQRLITRVPALGEWLSAYGGEGKISPVNCRNKRREISVIAGVAWIQNAMRHSFATYHLALFGDATQTAHQLGDGVDMLFRHYRGLADKADAERYFAIRPQKSKGTGCKPGGTE